MKISSVQTISRKEDSMSENREEEGTRENMKTSIGMALDSIRNLVTNPELQDKYSTDELVKLEKTLSDLYHDYQR